MRLYITAAGRYVGTQDDARKDGRGWRLEEVPTDKAGLIDYLNALSAKAEFAEVEEPVEDPTPPPPTITQPTLDAITAKVTAYKTTEIEDFILNHASVNQAANILSCLGTRFGELAKAVRS